MKSREMIRVWAVIRAMMSSIYVPFPPLSDNSIRFI